LDSPNPSAAGTWSRITGGLFLFVEAWLLLLLFTAGGVGLDIRILVYPWLAAMTLSAIWLVAARWLSAILPLAMLLGIGCAAFWGWVSATSSPILWIGFAVLVIPSLVAAYAAFRGLLRLRSN
jgi:hypothetical protein